MIQRWRRSSSLCWSSTQQRRGWSGWPRCCRRSLPPMNTGNSSPASGRGRSIRLEAELLTAPSVVSFFKLWQTRPWELVVERVVQDDKWYCKNKRTDPCSYFEKKEIFIFSGTNPGANEKIEETEAAGAAEYITSCASPETILLPWTGSTFCRC